MCEMQKKSIERNSMHNLQKGLALEVWRCEQGIYYCRYYKRSELGMSVMSLKGKNCLSCKIYSKEITCLKKNIIELEDNLKNLNQELKIFSERAEDLEDRLCREKKLRKQVEKDLNELKEQVESDSTSSIDESCHTDKEETNYDTRKSRTKAKHPTSRSLQSQRSKARARCKSETSEKSESDS